MPYLRLVGPDEVAVRVPARHHVGASAGLDRSRPAPIRLTRRGRIVIWLMLAAIAVVVVMLLAPAVAVERFVPSIT